VKPHLSKATHAGDHIYVSGQLARDHDGVISGDIARQTKQALENLRAVLADDGLDLVDVVKTTVWLTDRSDLPAFNEVYADCFGENRPARSTVISLLIVPEARVEIEAIAWSRVATGVS
jgi:2-iminobutanoate/2-iminopropanoate deaminase